MHKILAFAVFSLALVPVMAHASSDTASTTTAPVSMGHEHAPPPDGAAPPTDGGPGVKCPPPSADNPNPGCKPPLPPQGDHKPPMASDGATAK